MGSIRDKLLRAGPPNPYEPKNAGRISAECDEESLTATLVQKVGQNWEYGDELRIRVALNVLHELPLEDEYVLYWTGIEVAIRQSLLPSKEESYFVMAALEPVTWGWTACAPLRRVMKKDSAELRQQKIEQAWTADSDLTRFTWDPFHQKKGELLARLNDPLRLHYENGKDLGNGFLIGQQPAQVDETVWHFGICPATCLNEFGLTCSGSRGYPHQGMVRVPRREVKNDNEAALRYALAARSGRSFQANRQLAYDELGTTKQADHG